MSQIQPTPPPRNAASAYPVIDDPRAAVRRMLEEHAPCETGYPGVTSCKVCSGGPDCADALEAVLVHEFPGVDWAPAIREVLGLW